MRKYLIFGLTHSYPLFVAWHLQWGKWNLLSRFLFSFIPIIVMGGLMLIWANTSGTKLSASEVKFVKYYAFMVLLIGLYYCLCTLSKPDWVVQHNCQFCIFVIATLLFYLYNYFNANQ